MHVLAFGADLPVPSTLIGLPSFHLGTIPRFTHSDVYLVFNVPALADSNLQYGLCMLQRLGPFRIERRIGRGGMGTVFAAVHEETGEQVAIKVLTAAVAEDSHLRIRFAKEIETLKTLRHPHIVRLIGHGFQDGQPYYVMELVAGSSLQDELNAGRHYTWQEVAQIGIQVCLALKHAHDHGIIHRDIKPANLLRGEDQRIKLTDFGIAKWFGMEQLTAAGSVVGTADFMAPEQAERHAATYRTDLYSVGAVLFTLLAKRPPFADQTLPRIIYRLCHEPAPLIRTLVPQTPPEFERIIDQLLQKDPALRIPTALAVANRLRELTAMDQLTADRPSDPDAVASADTPPPASPPTASPEATRSEGTKPAGTRDPSTGSPAGDPGAGPAEAGSNRSPMPSAGQRSVPGSSTQSQGAESLREETIELGMSPPSSSGGDLPGQNRPTKLMPPVHRLPGQHLPEQPGVGEQSRAAAQAGMPERAGTVQKRDSSPVDRPDPVSGQSQLERDGQERSQNRLTEHATKESQLEEVSASGRTRLPRTPVPPTLADPTDFGQESQKANQHPGEMVTEVSAVSLQRPPLAGPQQSGPLRKTTTGGTPDHFQRVATDGAAVEQGEALSRWGWRELEIGSLALALLVAIGLIFYILQPLSADQLYSRILRSKHDLEAVKSPIDQFLESFPQDRRAAEIRGYERDIRSQWLVSRIRIKRDPSLRTPSETLFIQGMQELREGRADAARQIFLQLLQQTTDLPDVDQSAGQLNPAQTTSEVQADRVRLEQDCRELAEHQILRIDAASLVDAPAARSGNATLPLVDP